VPSLHYFRPLAPLCDTLKSKCHIATGARRQAELGLGAAGGRLKEGANINKSLLALGAVISKLGESARKGSRAKGSFIPFRDSKLTRILKNSLGGNTLTSILCTVTAAQMHHDETISTLKFGQLCKTIKNNARKNEVVDEKTLLRQ
jgi:centromeric protein E